MRIVHIQQYYNDGFGYQENILPSYQAKLGNEVILITSNLNYAFGNKDRKKTIGEYKDNNFLVKRIGIKGEFINRFVIFKDLYKVLEEIKPDYIFHHSPTCPSLITVCNYKKNNKNVFIAVDSHSDLTNSGKNFLWRKFYYNFFWSKLIKKYDKFIDIYFGVNANRCLFLEEELGINPEKIRFLPMGTDLDNIKIDEGREEFFNEYNIDSNNFILVHGGKIDKEKEVDKLIDAFSLIKGDKINLVIFGNIKDELVAEKMKKDNRIKYVGWLNRSNTLKMLMYSDLGVWNTQHTTLIEDAVAVGLPLIVRYYGCTNHLIDSSGIFLYSNSIRELYERINMLYTEKEYLKKLKKKAVELSKKLSYANVAYESIEYIKDKSPKELHKSMLNNICIESRFKYFRKVDRDK